MARYGFSTGASVNVSQDDIEDEEEIVWLIDPATMPYVRECIALVSSRQRPLKKCNGYQVVGYAVLPAATPGRSWFKRRCFWLKEYDRYYQPAGTYSVGTPAEGVDPLTVAPGVAGRKTDRSWGVTYSSAS